MTARHRVHDRSGAAAALAVGLLVVAAAVLGGVWYFVKHRSDPVPVDDPAPGLGAFGEAVPWDRVRIDEESGEFIMIVDAPAQWDLTEAELDDFYGTVEACRDYAGGSLAEFYPEAEGRLVRVRVVCPTAPPDEGLARLRAIARLGGAVRYDLAIMKPDGNPDIRPLLE